MAQQKAKSKSEVTQCPIMYCNAVVVI